MGKKRGEWFSTMIWSIVLICMIIQITCPETGIGGMINEGSMAVLFFCAGIICAWSAVKKRKEDKRALILGICLAISACIPGCRISGRLAADLIEGPHRVHLTSVTTEEINGLSGLISHHYYLCGRDEKRREYQLKISSDEYYELEGKQQVTVLCCPRTERVLKFL